MDIVRYFIAPYSVHICVEALTYIKTVLFKGVSLPFCKRVNDFSRALILVENVESYGTLNSVQIIVKS